MTVYKYFLKTALRHKWIIIGYAAIFFSISLIGGAGSGTSQGEFMEENLYIGVVDNSDSDLSRGLIEYLGEKNTLIQMEDNRDYIKEQIFLQSVHAVAIIPEDFESKVKNNEEAIEIFRDERIMGSMQVENQISKFLIFAKASSIDGNFDLERVENSLKEEVEVQLISGDNRLADDGPNTWFRFYFNFISYVIIAVYVAVIGLIMTDFNNKNIKDRMKISSKKFLRFNVEMYLGQVTLGILITSIFIIGALIIRSKDIGDVNLFKYVINTFVFSFSILCFTFLINNVTSSKFVINGLSTVASLGTAFISGVFVSQELLSESVLSIAKFFPTYYFVRINDMTVNVFSDMTYELSMQVLFGFAFLAIGLYFSKIRQKS